MFCEFNKKKPFWSQGLFCPTIGHASIKTIKEYIDNLG
ncbi:MAG: transposase [Promethearchaeota archaeon]